MWLPKALPILEKDSALFLKGDVTKPYDFWYLFLDKQLLLGEDGRNFS